MRAHDSLELLRCHVLFIDQRDLDNNHVRRCPGQRERKDVGATRVMPLAAGCGRSRSQGCNVYPYVPRRTV